jgi:hypothetical protein
VLPLFSLKHCVTLPARFPPLGPTKPVEAWLSPLIPACLPCLACALSLVPPINTYFSIYSCSVQILLLTWDPLLNIYIRALPLVRNWVIVVMKIFEMILGGLHDAEP